MIIMHFFYNIRIIISFNDWDRYFVRSYSGSGGPQERNGVELETCQNKFNLERLD